MKRWWVPLFVCLAVSLFWWTLTPPQAPVVAGTSPSPVAATVLQRQPAGQKPSVPPSVVTPPFRPIPRIHHTGPLALSEHQESVDEARPPIEQNGRRWQFLAGLSAVSVEANVPGEDLGQLSGYKIVPSSEVPEGVESFSLVKREDNGLVGIFTGVIRAVGERGTAGSFQSECPVQVKEAYPELKSYLLKASSEAELQECFQCLSNLQRFRSLDWEILDHPRTNR